MAIIPLLMGGGGFSPIVATGGTITFPIVNNTQYKRHTFSTPGTDQFVITALGSSQNPTVDIIMWGAGGGGGGGTGGGGGGGAYLRNSTFTISVETLNIGVGGGGRYGGGNSDGGTGGVSANISGNNYGYGGIGGAAGTGGSSASGGGGGGSSLILRSSTIVLAAGAGAGAGGTERGNLGSGGGGSSQNGQSNGYEGSGGGNAPNSNGGNGSPPQGGDFSAGGGGAGGYYGGSAGGQPYYDFSPTGGGGGGTNFAPASTIIDGSTGDGFTGGNAGNFSDPLNGGNYGRGSNRGGTGQNGIVYIQYPISNTITLPTAFSTLSGASVNLTVPRGANAIHIQSAVGGGGGSICGADYDKAGGESAGAGAGSGAFISDKVFSVTSEETLTLNAGVAGPANNDLGSKFSLAASPGGNTSIIGSVTGNIFSLGGGGGSSGLGGGVKGPLRTNTAGTAGTATINASAITSGTFNQSGAVISVTTLTGGPLGVFNQSGNGDVGTNPGNCGGDNCQIGGGNGGASYLGNIAGGVGSPTGSSAQAGAGSRGSGGGGGGAQVAGGSSFGGNGGSGEIVYRFLKLN
jgi:hypothetical protein